MQLYTGDFETTTDENDCHVWAYGISKLYEPEFFVYGTSIQDFMIWLEYECGNGIVYFHNAKFDTDFIMCWLFENGFEYVNLKRHPRDIKDIPKGMPREVSSLENKTFSTLISDKGQFYSLQICFYKNGKHKRQVKILDSLKLIPFSVGKIAKDFDLPIMKGEIDYNKPRPIGYIPDEKEIAYLRNDVEIMSRALSIMFENGLTKMTTASNALADFKSRLTGYQFRDLFPIPENDSFLREAYKGGFTYVAPRYKNIMIGAGTVFDVNSLYPWAMKNCLMPYGEGVYFEGKYKTSKLYTLYFQMFTCNFELKKNHIPTIQLKGNVSFLETEYAVDSKGEDVTLCLTSVDLKLFFDHYDVYNVEYICGYMYKGCHGIFDDYIDHWTNEKIQADIEENLAKRTIAKLMMNGLYGKFALNPECRSKHPVYMKDGSIGYYLGETETREPLYLPIGAFITAYAREKTIRSAQKLYPYFVYADTDSLHLCTTDIEMIEKTGIEIDKRMLGYWKYETIFKQAKFIRAKTYMELGKKPEEDDSKYKWKITCAGLPEAAKEGLTIKNFKPGTKLNGKLVPKHVKGGIVLVDREFTIKASRL